MCGGVAANTLLRRRAAEVVGGRARLTMPPLDLCTDNAAMIAAAGFYAVRSVRPTDRDGRSVARLVGVGVKGWTVVWRGERIQADLIAAVLQADGVRVEVLGDHAYGVGVNLTDARVMVPDDQAETARELIRQAEQEPAEPDV